MSSKFNQEDKFNNKLKTSFTQEWLKFYGTVVADYFFDIECDDNDNLFVAGRWGNYYAYLAKLDTNGNMDWNWTWDGGEISDGWGVAIDETNDFVYLAGNYGPYSGDKNVTVVKLDYFGNKIWSITWDKGGIEIARDVALDNDGNIFVVGSIDDTQAFLVKFNESDGSELWNITWKGGTTSYDSACANGIDISPSGDIYVIGTHEYDYSSPYGSIYLQIFYIIKFNSTADKQWERTYSFMGSNLTGGWDIIYGTDDYVYAVGSFNRDIQLSKLTPDNTEIYHIRYDFNNPDDGIGLALDSENNIYITGGTYNSSSKSWAAIMLKCSNSGTLLNNLTIDYAGEDRGYGVAVDSNDNAYFCGIVTFSGDQKQFILKMSPPIEPPGPFSLVSDAQTPIDEDGMFTLSWDDSSNVDTYTIYKSNKYISEINDTLDVIAEDVQDTSYPIQETQNDTYYYIVVAFNDDGNESSNCISVEVEIPYGKDDHPLSFELTTDAELPIDSDGNFNLTWTRSLNANNYSLYKSVDFITEINENVEFLNIFSDNGSSEIELTENGIYYFIVVAFNDNGNTSSNCISIEVLISQDNPPGYNIVGFGSFFLVITLISILGINIFLKRKIV